MLGCLLFKNLQNLMNLVHCQKDREYHQHILGQNRAEYRNWGKDITGLQTNRTYCHINGLKTQRS